MVFVYWTKNLHRLDNAKCRLYTQLHTYIRTQSKLVSRSIHIWCLLGLEQFLRLQVGQSPIKGQTDVTKIQLQHQQTNQSTFTVLPV